MRIYRNLIDVAFNDTSYSYDECIEQLNRIGVIPIAYENDWSFHIFKINRKINGCNEERVYFDDYCEITYTYEIVGGEVVGDDKLPPAEIKS